MLHPVPGIGAVRMKRIEGRPSGNRLAGGGRGDPANDPAGAGAASTPRQHASGAGQAGRRWRTRQSHPGGER